MIKRFSLIVAALVSLVLVTPIVSNAAYVQPSSGGRDGWLVDTVTGDLILMRAGTLILRITTAGVVKFTGGSALMNDNSSTGFSLGSTGFTNQMVFDTTNGAEKVTVNSVWNRPVGVYETFAYGAAKGVTTRALAGGAYDGTTAAYNVAVFGSGTTLLYTPLGAGQTLDIAMVASGLDITGDQADDEGFELTSGLLGASGRPMIPGVDPAFKFCATINIHDVSDTDDLHVGWRKPEAVNATFLNYNTYASIGIDASAATAAIKLDTEDDAGGTTSTDTTNTWADDATKALCILVDAAGAVTYTINGAAPTVTAAFTFDSGEPVIPFVWWIHAGATDCVPIITKWQVALQ